MTDVLFMVNRIADPGEIILINLLPKIKLCIGDK